MSTPDVTELLRAATDGDRRSLARLLTLVERGGPAAAEVGAQAHRAAGTAHVIGMTGAPGAGKSTLTSALCDRIRAGGDRVSVLAIDPSSPFSGGAILGDRVRMGDHSADDGVFIRSMATRGHLGGLSLAAPAAVRVLDAVGFPWVVLETVGVGQVEVEVVGTADTVVVVVNPGWGDAVQANKAGLMEIADVFVVNKADRPGASDTATDLRQMLAMRADDDWTPPIVMTDARSADGVDELLGEIAGHAEWLRTSGRLEERRADRLRDEIVRTVEAMLVARVDALADAEAFDAICARVAARELDPWGAARSLLARVSGDEFP